MPTCPVFAGPVTIVYARPFLHFYCLSKVCINGLGETSAVSHKMQLTLILQLNVQFTHEVCIHDVIYHTENGHFSGFLMLFTIILWALLRFQGTMGYRLLMINPGYIVIILSCMIIHLLDQCQIIGSDSIIHEQEEIN